MGLKNGEALGMIETLGMVPALYGADFMLKAADVELVSYENVGSTLVTVIIKGEVAAVTSAVEAGAKAAASGGKTDCPQRDSTADSGCGCIVAVHGIEA